MISKFDPLQRRKGKNFFPQENVDQARLEIKIGRESHPVETVSTVFVKIKTRQNQKCSSNDSVWPCNQVKSCSSATWNLKDLN